MRGVGSSALASVIVVLLGCPLIGGVSNREPKEADRTHAGLGKLLQRLAVIEGIEVTHVDRTSLEVSDLFPRGLSESQHHVRL